MRRTVDNKPGLRVSHSRLPFPGSVFRLPPFPAAFCRRFAWALIPAALAVVGNEIVKVQGLAGRGRCRWAAAVRLRPWCFRLPFLPLGW